MRQAQLSGWDQERMVALPGTIGVTRPIHLYLELEAWRSIQDIPKSSFHTLLRALDKCGCVRFRKTAGQHPNCDTCMHFKRLLRAPTPQTKNPQQRTLVLEDYCNHLMLQWSDSGVESNSTELSRTCLRMLDMGILLMRWQGNPVFGLSVLTE